MTDEELEEYSKQLHELQKNDDKLYKTLGGSKGKSSGSSKGTSKKKVDEILDSLGL